MGLISKILQKEEEAMKASSSISSPQQKTVEDDPLTKEEYEIIFNLIKNSTFKGTELEGLYVLILKLQKRYIDLTKKG